MATVIIKSVSTKTSFSIISRVTIRNARASVDVQTETRQLMAIIAKIFYFSWSFSLCLDGMDGLVLRCNALPEPLMQMAL